eukprot:TRINITY_DN67029_c3_g7_i1.p1 TRINITY_DN67029_c3_g7~~TRINITY_DN67029_c3_g7_i1.p1  ORF type:complete len:827 (+),score=51.22 TRINITY_DN67029_c3_g7_i1:30-2483(+)
MSGQEQLDNASMDSNSMGESLSNVQTLRIINVTFKLGYTYEQCEDDHWIIKPKLSNMVSATIPGLGNYFEQISGPKIEYVQMGWPGAGVSYDQREAFIESCKKSPFNLAPIFPADEAAIASAYQVFLKGYLWPFFHYSSRSFQREPYENYKKVMAEYGEAIKQEYFKKPDVQTVILLHDYHLVLLGAEVRKLLPHATIAFFLHSQFPSVELFRQMPIRSPILRSLLDNDVVGFQTFNYSRHFGIACHQVLGAEKSPRGVMGPNGKLTACIIRAAGIDVQAREQLVKANLEELKKEIQELKTSLGLEGRKLIVGRSFRLDINSGIKPKFEAYEKLLDQNPDLRENTVFMHCVGTLCGDEPQPSEEVLQLKGEIDSVCGRIGMRLGSFKFIPANFRDLGGNEISALAVDLLADVIVITPTRDGLNLHSHEALLAQSHAPLVDEPLRNAPLVLSEFTGSAMSLSGARIVNPHNQDQLAEAMLEALNMSEAEKKKKFKANLDYIQRNHSFHWWVSVLDDVLTNTDASPPSFRAASPAVAPPPSLVPVPFPMETCVKHYKEAKKALFLSDYDGTLTAIVAQPEDAKPSAKLRTALKGLCDSEKATFYAVSGRDRGSLAGWLGDLPIGIVTEHGCFCRQPGVDNMENWSPVETDISWRETIIKVMQDFTECTPGSRTEEKEVNITWHYRNAEEKFARWQAKDLEANLMNLASSFDIDICPGKMAVEVRPFGVNKGTSVFKILDHLVPNASEIGWIMCAGDDTADDQMFDAVHQWCDNNPTQKVSAYTIVVGRTTSKAKYKVDSHEDVIALLEACVATDGTVAK